MSIEQLDVVDMVSLEPKTGNVILTISDHLDWSDTIRHQEALQKKFNAYLSFVESGEILQRYPEAQGKFVVFTVVFKYRPDSEGRLFIAKARQVIESAGFSLRDELFAESWNN
jgi:hypothetical protein